MSPDVLTRKLLILTKYLDELAFYEHVSLKEFMEDHYKIERLIELIVITACDMVFHFLMDRGEPPPGSYRAAFLRIGEKAILSEDLSRRLAQAAGLCNILVHGYEDVDPAVVHESIPMLLGDMRRFKEAFVDFGLKGEGARGYRL